MYWNPFLGAQTIQGGVLLFQFSSTCAHYSRAQSVQGGILFKEIGYMYETPLRCKILLLEGTTNSFFTHYT